MKTKFLLVLSVALVATFVFSSCTPTPAATAAPAAPVAPATPSSKPAKVYKVAGVVADLENPAWNAMYTGFVDKATELGMSAKLYNSSGKADVQFKNAQDIVTQAYDAVVVSGTDSSTANAPVKAFNAAKIPVWILHIKPDDPTATFVAMGDAQNVGGNYDAGIYLAKTYKDKGMTGVAAEITISLARSNGAARHQGFKQAMDEKGIKLAEVKEAIVYTRDEAYKFAQDLINAHPDLSILWCNYDEAALGAMKAIQDAGKGGKILLGGFDGSPESLKAVKDGKINVMAIQPLYYHGTLIAQEMYDYFTSGKTPETFSTPCPLVTTENAATDAAKYLSQLYGPTAKFPS
jgi:ribose transport system substrate-binding protein